MLYLQLPLVKPYIQFSPAKAGLSDHLLPVGSLGSDLNIDI